MTLHPASASSQPQAVATAGIRQAFRVMDEYCPATESAPACQSAARPVVREPEPERLDLLSRRRRRRARLEARW